jgi:L-lysine 6-transaminase
MKLETIALGEIKDAIAQHGPDIAALIIEPIQGEGGDNHFRNEFFVDLRSICNENHILFIMDEVQSGIGITGKFWAHEHTGVTPDLLSFGKKTQVCGMLGSARLDETKSSVFSEASRINSTFGGNLVDMARCSAILKIIEKEDLLTNARLRGDELRVGLENLAAQYPSVISAPRGTGLMCAFNLGDTHARDAFLLQLRKEKLLVVGCGEKSIRFRPHLNITEDEVSIILSILGTVLTTA